MHSLGKDNSRQRGLGRAPFTGVIDLQQPRQESSNQLMRKAEFEQLGSAHNSESDIGCEVPRAAGFVIDDPDMQFRYEFVIQHIPQFAALDPGSVLKLTKIQRLVPWSRYESWSVPVDSVGPQGAVTAG
jgi:hypothetical protein